MTDTLQCTARAFLGNGGLRALLIAAVILVLLGLCGAAVPALRRVWRERAARTNAWGRAAAAMLYPLALVDVERTGLWMQSLYLATLAYLVVLLILRRAHPTGINA